MELVNIRKTQRYLKFPAFHCSEAVSKQTGACAARVQSKILFYNLPIILQDMTHTVCLYSWRITLFHWQAGFNAGDGVRFFSIPGSATDQVIDIPNKSNVGRPGRWMFRIDATKIEAGGCNTNGESGHFIKFHEPVIQVIVTDEQRIYRFRFAQKRGKKESSVNEGHMRCSVIGIPCPISCVFLTLGSTSKFMPP